MRIKRILVSLVSISIAFGVVAAGTTAFFTDTQTSGGNVFTAGSIDLKVNHTYAAYNGSECTEDNCETVGENLIVNGGFEEPIVATAQNWNIFPHTTVNGWSAEWINVVGGSQPAEANIELHRGVNSWLSQGGQQHAELDADWDGPGGPNNNEQSLTRIYQDVSTELGAKYELAYYHSYRPGTGADENEMRVYWDGVEIKHITDANGTGQTQTNWKEYKHTVYGDGTPVRLEFEGAGPNNSQGIFLDSVSIFKLDCDYSMAGGQCKLWDSKDLEENDFFFNFDDVKPGDSGVNVISLTVHDNDAWACLLSHDISGTDAEILGGYMKVFAWNDLDNDGVYDPGESLYTPNPVSTFFVGGNFLTIADSLLPPPLSALQTEYVGLAWCLGDMNVDHGTGAISCDGSAVGNDAQNATLSASITAYARQHRNNPNFLCESVTLP